MRRTWAVPVLPAISKPGSVMRQAIGRAARLVADRMPCRRAPRRALRPRRRNGAIGGRGCCLAADIAGDARRHRLAAGDARRQHAQLQRRHQHIALADAGDQRFALLPGHAEGRALPGLRRDQARALARQFDAGGRAQAELVRVYSSICSMPSFIAMVVEEDVAGLLDRASGSCGHAPVVFPAMEFVIAEPHHARAIDDRNRAWRCRPRQPPSAVAVLKVEPGG